MDGTAKIRLSKTDPNCERVSEGAIFISEKHVTGSCVVHLNKWWKDPVCCHLSWAAVQLLYIVMSCIIHSKGNVYTATRLVGPVTKSVQATNNSHKPATPD